MLSMQFRLLFCAVLMVMLVLPVFAHEPLRDYELLRAQMITRELSQAMGGSIKLSPIEQKANAVITQAKQVEWDRYPQLPSLHFFDAKPLIQKSPLFDMLVRMPKGGALHVHSDSNVPLEWVIAKATYDDALYMCGEFGLGVQLKFFDVAEPGTEGCPTSWQSVAALRRSAGNSSFDTQLLGELTLYGTGEPYPTLDAVWAKFNHILVAAAGLVFYEPFHYIYLKHHFELMKADGVQHVELRQVFQKGIGNTYAANGTVFSPQHTVDHIVKAAAEVGMSVKIIYCMVRTILPEEVGAGLRAAEAMMQDYPGVVVGFDLVGQEDIGNPLSAYINQLLNATIPFFFHAGETDRAWGASDVNLFDAMLLNTSRIGHGYGLARHPDLKKQVLQRNTCIEVCPISNQVLKLVGDLRDHPLVSFVSEGLPLTVSPDDGGVWGASDHPTTYDWFQFFVASGNQTGLPLLKQLALNSLTLSALSDVEKKEHVLRWEKSWGLYVAWLAQQ